MPQKSYMPYEFDVSSMCRMKVKDLAGLKQLLEDVKFMEPVYSRFIRKPILQARMNLYKHGDGVEIAGKSQRYWIYVTISNPYTTCDAALWKILRYARMHQMIFARLKSYVDVEW